MVAESGATDLSFQTIQSTFGLTLPAPHEEVLRWSNGFAVYDGYFRIFGLGSRRGIDAIRWNEPDCWKFAWGSCCQEFWCFGETAWGDQYAYKMHELSRGNNGVFFLDCLSMRAEQIASSFEDFYRQELVRNATNPYDEMILKARSVLGPLSSDLLLVYSPSLLLGGVEDIANVQKIDRRVAMVCNGDVAIQLDKAEENEEITGVQTYDDEFGRARIRLLWKK